MPVLSRMLLIALLGALAWGCTPRPRTKIAGVAPMGVYVFTGIVEGERVSGTLAFGDPIVVSGDQGRCVRQIDGIKRWTGLLAFNCPGLSLRVRVDDDGGIQDIGRVRVMKPGFREERTTCRSFDDVRRVCVAWNTATVEYDRWVEGSVTLKPQGG